MHRIMESKFIKRILRKFINKTSKTSQKAKTESSHEKTDKTMFFFLQNWRNLSLKLKEIDITFFDRKLKLVELTR